MKKRVKAFTIMEVTIAMLITALVIGITYSAYLIVSKSYRSFADKNDRMAELGLFDKLLKKDISRSTFIGKDSTGILIRMDTNRVKYDFLPDYIIRRSGRIDTFKFRPDSLRLSFEGRTIDTLSADTEKSRVDEIAFTITLENQKIPYHYRKQYSSQELIKRLPDAVH